jgi:hypothetical protein
MSYINPFFNDAVAGTPVLVKPMGATSIYLMKLVNTTAATAYLQVFAVSQANVTLGTTVPYWVIRLTANESVTAVLGGPIPALIDGAGLTIAGTTTPGGLTGAAISVSLLYA